ncbi:MAG TPA: hypothetical protein G4O03_08445 [Dehalococcoidia bacterium]|nr:hypothetical protein [Dehalococcoidia bacterium]
MRDRAKLSAAIVSAVSAYMEMEARALRPAVPPPVLAFSPWRIGGRHRQLRPLFWPARKRGQSLRL